LSKRKGARKQIVRKLDPDQVKIELKDLDPQKDPKGGAPSATILVPYFGVDTYSGSGDEGSSTSSTSWGSRVISSQKAAGGY
jgi:hypothetical protein